jgi:hypothetical protein
MGTSNARGACMQVIVEVLEAVDNGKKFAATYELPAVPSKGDRIIISGWNASLETAEVWWSDRELPRVILLGGVPGAHVRGPEWNSA